MRRASFLQRSVGFGLVLAFPLLVGAKGNGGGCAAEEVPIGADETCGNSVCGADEFCCNESCGICAPKGGACIQLACEPGSDAGTGEACGDVTCAVGQVCCNESCGICTEPGGACIQLACESDAGAGEPCGKVTCAVGEECCNESCGICTEPGGACIQLLCDDDDRTPATGACIKNSNDTCTSDADCTAGGCGGELCFNPAVSSGISTCECTTPAVTGCGCVAGQCTWYN